ncbi:hypothetical protein C1646_770273 [Rhizophagus diaphanus]|nr:hypothetical protein C1646_770273 [Rhizophagus diaphanus] [Rhizophagus sp. MUCL 43196]
MFRNRYVSFNHRQNYIRYPHNTFNVSLDDEENINEETDYDEPNNYETLNETETDYLIPNENLFNEILNDENDEEIDYEDYFDDEILNDNEMSTDSNNGTLNEEEPDKIVDKALNSEQVPSMSGVFAPYFENITSALLFCWIQKHNISTQAYDELVDIIRHPQFKREDVVTNIRRQKTPSTSQNIKEMYYLSITDIIWHSLNNPSLFSKMYFGPGQIVKRNRELWHRTIWKESPRFGHASFQMNGTTYNCGEFIVYKESITRNNFGQILAIVDADGKLKVLVQRIIQFAELPTNLQSRNRRERSYNEVWLLDREMENAIIIELQKIVRLATIVILYNEDNINNITSIFIHLYYDFGTFRNVYHSLGGVYVQIGNLPFDKRKQLKNHFGFVPFGGSFNEFIRPFIDEMKQLEKEIIMDVQGNRSFVIASLEDVTADLPQENELAGLKDIISLASNITRSNEIATMYGLRLQPSILDELKRERHFQSPQDVYHLTSGKVLKFLKITIEALSLVGKSEFIKFWKSFEYPKTWQKLPNPISHIDSFMMSDCLHLAMMIPFILNRFLKPTHFKKLELALFQRQTRVSRSDLAVNLWVKCWVLMARTMTIAFKHSFTEEDYIQLHECLDSERKLFSQAFEDFENLPNLHVNYHLLLHARNYATLLNTGVGTKEMVHRIFKNIVL